MAEEFPFSNEEFEIIYSGSVLHVLPDLEAISQYIQNSFMTLRAGGVVFGSTLGKRDPTEEIRGIHPIILTEMDLRNILEQNGFDDIEIQPTDQGDRIRYWFWAEKPE